MSLPQPQAQRHHQGFGLPGQNIYAESSTLTLHEIANACPPQRLDLRISRWAILVIAFFILINAVAIVNLRGVADPEGYPLNTSRKIPLNSHEDDGSLNIYAILGYSHLTEDRFGSYFNIGGPFLHLGTAVAILGDRFGLIKRFDDSRLYWQHPDEYRKVWQFFGFYKLFLLAWLPVAVYWFASNHFSRRAALLATILTAAMPFIPGFELRMKVDSACITAGIVGLMLQVQHAKWGRPRHLYWAAVWLGLGLSMKFVMLPTALTFILAHVLGTRALGQPVTGATACKRLALGIGLSLLVFVASNPFIFWGVASTVAHYARQIPARSMAEAKDTVPASLWFRLTHFGSFLGWVGNLTVLPALGFAALQSFGRNRRKHWGPLFLLVFFALDMAYLLAHEGATGMRIITYYYFAASVILCLLVASLLDRLWDWSGSAGPWAKRGAFLLFLWIAGTTAMNQALVLRDLYSPSNRQEALTWIASNVPESASIGIPRDAGSSPIDSMIWLDPFKYPVFTLGKHFAVLDRQRPEYLLDVGAHKPRFPAWPQGYRLRAWFERDSGLEDDLIGDINQAEAYRVYQRETPAQDADRVTLEYALGRFTRNDPEPEFNILLSQSSVLFPISMEMFRKTQGTVLPMGLRPFSSSLRQGKDLDYLHQADPLCLPLWGVKYLLAKTGPGTAVDQALASGLYALAPAAGWKAPDGADAALLANRAYLGQATFIPDRDPFPGLRGKPRLKGLVSGDIPTYGRLASAEEVAQAGTQALEVTLSFENENPVDCILSGGPRPQSLLLQPGTHFLSIPYTIREGDLRLEINPVGKPGRVTVLEAKAAPLAVEGSPVMQSSSVATGRAFAVVDSQKPGRVIFALPWHGYWSADIDGSPSKAVRGPANTVAVHIPAGRHFVSLRLAN